jgi:tetratricopeptide (TPR) repeat protein
MRSRWLWITLSVGVIAGAWGGLTWLEERRFRNEISQAEREIAGGRFHRARERLTVLVKRRPDSSAALYQLGLCEERLGRSESALEAWSRIPIQSTLAVKATLGRARLLINSGRLAPAEAILLTLPRDSRLEGRQAVSALELLYHIEGRTAEIRALIEEEWAGSGNPAAVLNRLYLLDNSTFPADYVRTALQAGDPNDDRVWLGKANLANWSGRFDEAARWLVRCAERQPDDIAVWRARLKLAQASGDTDTFKLALEHLPLGEFTHSEVLEFRAWLAARAGDLELERASLLALVGEVPGHTGAWDRLAELALLRGRKADAEQFLKKKAQINRTREEYRRLISRDDRADHCGKLAVLAQQLGRRTEARGWSLIDQGRARAEPLVLAEEQSTRRAPQGARLSFAMTDLLPGAKHASTLPGPGSAGRQIDFADEATSARLVFLHDNGHTRRNPPPPEAMCGGVGLLDYDGDGWLDVYAVQGGPFPLTHAGGNEGDRLFRNRGDGTFEDVTTRSGIASFKRGYGHGVTVADYDNDGRPDLFITRWRSYALYRNQGDGTFADVTAKAGLDGERDWPTSAAFADLDGDGDLDLYVCHYLAYDPANPRRCTHPESPSKHTCNPLDFAALPDHVFRNDGGRFTDVTAGAGFVDPDGRGLGVVAAHLDQDDRIDLYVANDMTANYLFHNVGGFRFEEIGDAAGAAASADGGYKAGMGVACGDLDGDGLIDLAVTNYFGESTTFYRNLGGGFFADHSNYIGLAAPTRRLLGFGIAFMDVDNDGWLDVLSANGHVIDSRPQIPWTMPLQLLKGAPGGRLSDVSEEAGAPFRQLHLGRGVAMGDLDNDGRLDAVVIAQNEPLVYLHNRSTDRGHFITFWLEGTKSNRDGIGARVAVVAGGRRQAAERFGGGSYLSASDPRLHFGLGERTSVESLEIRWPSGRVDCHTGLKADRQYRIREGKAPVEIRQRPAEAVVGKEADGPSGTIHSLR